jgi:hypothetical protein
MIKQSFSLLIRSIGKSIIKQIPGLKKLTISMLVFLFVFSSPGFAFAVEEMANPDTPVVATENDFPFLYSIGWFNYLYYFFLSQSHLVPLILLHQGYGRTSE